MVSRVVLLNEGGRSLYTSLPCAHSPSPMASPAFNGKELNAPPPPVSHRRSPAEPSGLHFGLGLGATCGVGAGRGSGGGALRPSLWGVVLSVWPCLLWQRQSACLPMRGSAHPGLLEGDPEGTSVGNPEGIGTSLLSAGLQVPSGRGPLQEGPPQEGRMCGGVWWARGERAFSNLLAASLSNLFLGGQLLSPSSSGVGRLQVVPLHIRLPRATLPLFMMQGWDTATARASASSRNGAASPVPASGGGAPRAATAPPAIRRRPSSLAWIAWWLRSSRRGRPSLRPSETPASVRASRSPAGADEPLGREASGTAAGAWPRTVHGLARHACDHLANEHEFHQYYIIDCN